MYENYLTYGRIPGTVVYPSLTIFSVCSLKVEYHMDELMTFGLANNSEGIYPNIEERVIYSDMGPLKSYLQVDSDNRFNYINVWRNQGDDVHPSLYYIFIHTICSFFPNSYNMWYGLIVNLLCIIIIDILLYKICFTIFGNDIVSYGAVVTYGTSIIFLNMISFTLVYYPTMLYDATKRAA